MLANLTPNIVGCYMLGPFAHPVACCCAKFETSQTFQPTTPNISFVPWSPKRSATMLDSFAQLFQHCWGHARLLRMDCKDLWVVSFPLLGVVASVCTTTANTHATTPNIVGATISWELLRSFARSHRIDLKQWYLRGIAVHSPFKNH